MPRALRVAIAGAGIGGLTLALALRRAGFEVIVAEQASALGEVGAGLQIGPNAVKVLTALGLGDALRAVGFRPQAMESLDWRTGLVLRRNPIDRAFEAAYGAPYLHVHRADLHALLAAALPCDSLRLGTRITGLRQSQVGAVLELADGGEIGADLVVGADGVHSAIRAALFGDDAPRVTGNVAWRALVPVDRLPAGLVKPNATIWLGPAAHFVHYLLRGGTLVNLVAIRETDEWAGESWTSSGDPAELRAAFRGWNGRLRRLLDAVESCGKWMLLDRDPLPRWSSGRVTLLGDAAHPTLPFLAQGAAMAIEDGWVLAACLASASSDLPAALASYEKARMKRTAGIQLGSRSRGRSMHVSGVRRLRRDLRFAADRLLRPGDMIEKGQPLYGHDVVARLPIPARAEHAS